MNVTGAAVGGAAAAGLGPLALVELLVVLAEEEEEEEEKEEADVKEAKEGAADAENAANGFAEEGAGEKGDGDGWSDDVVPPLLVNRLANPPAGGGGNGDVDVEEAGAREGAADEENTANGFEDEGAAAKEKG